MVAYEFTARMENRPDEGGGGQGPWPRWFGFDEPFWEPPSSADSARRG